MVVTKRKEQDLEKQTISMDFYPKQAHKVPLDELCLQLNLYDVHAGLTTNQINEAQNKYGLNQIPSEPKPGYLRLIFSETFTGFNSLLWIATILAFLAYRPLGDPHPDPSNLGLAIILSLVILANAGLSIYQKIKSTKIVESFARVMPKLTTVRRNHGREQLISTGHIVPGDIIVLHAGDKVPADCRIVSCENLRVNNAQLTGESKPITCTTVPTSENCLTSKNMLFYSSLVIEGFGEAIVVATGEQTILGRVSKLTRSSTKDDITNLHRQVNRFLLIILCATLLFIMSVWITWSTWLNRSFPGYIEMHANIINSIGMIVGFLPVGLPSAVTLVLVIIAKYMSSQKALVMNLQSLETFNSVSLICTDKTGTLTKNKMTCTHLLWDINEEYRLPIATKESKLESKSVFDTFISRLSISSLSMLTRNNNSIIMDDVQRSKHLDINEIYLNGQPQRDLLLGACLCNNAEKRWTENEQNFHISGDSDDIAFYNLCEDQFNIDVEHIRHNYPRLHCLPFNADNKYMIVANQLPTQRHFGSAANHQPIEILLTIKGATDVLLTNEICSTYQTDIGDIKDLTDDLRTAIIRRHEYMGSHGYRVIAMLQRKVDQKEFDKIVSKNRTENPQTPFPITDYTFIGLFCLMDPPRYEVVDAVRKARQAKIRVAMVTGDHPATAVSLAKQVHILSPEIIQNYGFDSFQLVGIDTPTGRPMIQLLRNGEHLDTHVLGMVSDIVQQQQKLENDRTQLIRKNETSIISLGKRLKKCFNYYFSETKPEIDPQKKAPLIPYAMVIKGSDIAYLDDFMWSWILSHQELIFARTSPEQKLRIVMECQRRSEVVAVTGDGTYDAPALKRADLGIAMQSGSDVSKEACDIVLIDNNFTSIINAIETGRLLNDNLKKVSIYLIPGGSWSQIWPVFLNIWLGVPLALSAFQATIFCMLNDVFMSLAMAAEKPEKDIMRRPPVQQNVPRLIDWKLLFHAYLIIGNIECLSSFFCYFFWYYSNGIPVSRMFFKYSHFDAQFNAIKQPELDRINETGQCIYYVSLCIMQFFNFLTTRTRYASFFTHNPFWSRRSRNLWLILSILISISICVCVTEIPFIQRHFKTHRVPVLYVLPALGFGLLMLTIDELRKLYIRRNPNCYLSRMAW